MDVHLPGTYAHSPYADSLDDKSIRLLRFSQKKGGAVLGELRVFPLDTTPPFYAASYVWGDQTYSDTRLQLSGEQTLPVLNSLIPFLQMVSEHADFKDTDWWWIDSLCINLENTLERETQVQLMARIYSTASKAIVWLGDTIEGESDCTGVVDYLYQLAYMDESTRPKEIPSRRKITAPVPTFQAVVNLLSRPWWTRVWTLQEFTLPKEPYIYCGPSSISRECLVQAINNIHGLKVKDNMLQPEGKEVSHKSLPIAMNRGILFIWHSKSGSVDLVSVMAHLGCTSATDNRDRIYSVMGLITDRDRKLIGRPDYSSVWNEYQSLDIMCFVHLLNQYSTYIDAEPHDMTPSWAPDWRATYQRDVTFMVLLMANQSANPGIGNYWPKSSQTTDAVYDAPGPLRKDPQVCFSEDSKEITCHGILVDTLTALGALLELGSTCESLCCAANGHDLLQNGDSQHMDLTPTQILATIGRTLVLDREDIYMRSKASELYITEFERMCSCCAKNLPVHLVFAEWFESNKKMRFGSYTLEDLAVSSVVDLSEPGYDALKKHRFSPSVGAYVYRFVISLKGILRRIMVTRGQLIGMAPCRARLGDVVAILAGCSIPLILRKVEDQDAWQVIGEAYVDGYMNGEVAELVEKGEMKMEILKLV